jgi:hypothetical protein
MVYWNYLDTGLFEQIPNDSEWVKLSWKVGSPVNSLKATTHTTKTQQINYKPLVCSGKETNKKLEIDSCRGELMIKILASFSCSQAAVHMSLKCTSTHWMQGIGVCCGVTTAAVNMLNQLVINSVCVWESVNWWHHCVIFEGFVSPREESTHVISFGLVVTVTDHTFLPYVMIFKAAVWNAVYFLIHIYFPNGCDGACGRVHCSVLKLQWFTDAWRHLFLMWGWGFHSGEGTCCGRLGWPRTVWHVVT